MEEICTRCGNYICQKCGNCSVVCECDDTSDARRNYWMVHNPANRGPTKRHLTIIAAKKEAQRLARKYPGQEFFILKTVMGFTTTNEIKELHMI